MKAPIALFVYSRPQHTRQTVESLLKNRSVSQYDLIVFSDGPRSPEFRKPVADVREYINGIKGFRSIRVVCRTSNYGLARNIIEGVTEVLSMWESIIVLEDDMVTSPYFLDYMSEALERFAADDRVVSIHGYIYPVKQPLPEVFFLRGADCWGWATWQRGWNIFNSNGQALLDELKDRCLTAEFDFNNSYPYTKMLEDQIQGRNSSWAIRWYASAFLAGKMTLYPGRSLVHNIGNDSSGTHCSKTVIFDTVVSDRLVNIGDVAVTENIHAKRAIEMYFRSQFPWINRFVRSTLSDKILNYLKSISRQFLNNRWRKMW